MTLKLVITIPLEGESEESTYLRAKQILSLLFNTQPSAPKEATLVALLRDGDRSGGNLLLPRLEGRLGWHLQGRKAQLTEVLGEEKSK